MYHGEDSGHLIIFVNGQVIQISFNQKETKTYNFFIERQLIELQIEKDETGYDYTVTPQRPVATHIEEKTFDKHFWIPLILILVILNLAFYLMKYKMGF